MKKLNSSKNKPGILFPFGITLLAAIFSIMTGCTKIPDTDYTGTPGGPKGQGANEVYIINMAFSPATITVTANTTVKWTNKDGMAHTVTSDTGLFDSGSIGSNSTFSYTFTTAGSYAYHCTPHPSMKGTVVVN